MVEQFKSRWLDILMLVITAAVSIAASVIINGNDIKHLDRRVLVIEGGPAFTERGFERRDRLIDMLVSQTAEIGGDMKVVHAILEDLKKQPVPPEWFLGMVKDHINDITVHGR